MTSIQDNKAAHEYVNVEEMMVEGKEVPSGRTVLEFDGNNQVLCRVCGDKASGFHYGVHSCEGCKGFFRRSIQKKIQYRRCNKGQQCDVLRVNRNRCQSCRLKKCISAGMSKDAVRFGRVPKREKAKMLAAMERSLLKTQESRVMNELADPSLVIEVIVNAHYNSCDFTRDKLDYFISLAKANHIYAYFTGSACPMKGSQGHFLIEEYSEKFMDHVRQVCSFAKLIPGFKCLDRDDQVTLLKLCIFEVLFVRMSGLIQNENLFCLNGDTITKEMLYNSTIGNARILTNSVFKMAHKLNQYCLSDEEIGLFCAIIIISPDRHGLKNPDLLRLMQNKLKVIFGNMLTQHFSQAAPIGEFMKIINDLRCLNSLHAEAFHDQAGIVNSELQQAHKVQKALDGSHHRLQRKEFSEIGSSDTNSNNSEDISQSPIGSISSSESNSSGEVFRLTEVRTQHCSEMSAMSSMASRKLYHDSSTLVRNKQCHPFPTTSKPIPRKLESPMDSGIDSPQRHLPTPHSTNTSVCSSPLSSIEDEKCPNDIKRMASGPNHQGQGCPKSHSRHRTFSSVFFETNLPNKVEWSHPERYFQGHRAQFYPESCPVQDASSMNKTISKIPIERKYLDHEKISSAIFPNYSTNLPKRLEPSQKISLFEKDNYARNFREVVKSGFYSRDKSYSTWTNENYSDFPVPVKQPSLFKSHRIPIPILKNPDTNHINDISQEVRCQLAYPCPVSQFPLSQTAPLQVLKTDGDFTSDALPLNLSTKI